MAYGGGGRLNKTKIVQLFEYISCGTCLHENERIMGNGGVGRHKKTTRLIIRLDLSIQM